jgi:dihydroorotase
MTLSTLVRGARVIDPAAGIDGILDVRIAPEGISLDPEHQKGATLIDGRGLWLVPGLIDLQVHFREPGQTHKEDLFSGARAAVAGGVSSVVVMPNTRPVLDDPALVRMQGELAERHGLARVFVAAAATKGSLGKEISDYRALKAAGAVAVTDDGLPILEDDVMRAALVSAKESDLLVMQHAEDTRITHHVPMTACIVQERAGIEGQPPEAEWKVVERDVRFAKAIGARYHVLHLSTKQSLQAVRAAKAQGARVSCEVSPHHLFFTHDDVVVMGRDTPRGETDLDPNKKMNPPLRSGADRRALVEGLADGTVDAVATDHAPHHSEEKQKGFVAAPFGVTGLETLFSVVFRFAADGIISDVRAVSLLTSGPARVLGRTGVLGTLSGVPDATLIDPRREWTVSTGSVVSRSKNSAFLGRTMRGMVLCTFVRGRRVFDRIPA